jgi:hypothetical protein
LRSAPFWLSRIVSRLPLSRSSGPALPTTSLRSWSRPCSEAAVPDHEALQVAPRRRRERADHLVELRRRLDLRVGSLPPSGIFGAAREPGDSST